MPFNNYDFKETLIGHSTLLWLIDEKYDFLQEIQSKEEGNTWEDIEVTPNLLSLER